MIKAFFCLGEGGRGMGKTAGIFSVFEKALIGQYIVLDLESGYTVFGKRRI
jgi:hypothetical protein